MSSRSQALAATLSVFLMACGSGGEDPPKAAAQTTEPKLYWDVELVGTGATKPDRISTDIDRLFDDGSLIVKRAPGREVALRSPEGAWRVLMPPPPESGSQFGYLTYYVNDDNYGGISSTGGYLVLGGKVSKCSEKIGGACEPRGLLPDGSVLTISTNEEGNTYLQSWRPGENDALDVADIFYEANAANGNSAAFARLATDGTILMLPYQPVSSLGGDRNSTIVILKEGMPVDLGSAQFNHGEPVDLDTEAVLGQAVVDITRSGAILGQKDGRPVLKTGADYDFISEERATPIAANTEGDVIYQTGDGVSHVRWHGKHYALDTTDWTSVSGALSDPLHLDIVDINAPGQVLFYGPARGGEPGVRLYLATPSVKPPPPHLFAHLTFRGASGSDAPATLDVTSSSEVVGSLSGGGLSLTVSGPAATKGKLRILNIVITRPSGELAVGEALPAATRVTADGTFIATVSYADPPTSALAADGTITLTDIQDSSFKLSLENVQMKDSKTGAAFTVDGYAEAQR